MKNIDTLILVYAIARTIHDFSLLDKWIRQESIKITEKSISYEKWF